MFITRNPYAVYYTGLLETLKTNAEKRFIESAKSATFFEHFFYEFFFSETVILQYIRTVNPNVIPFVVFCINFKQSHISKELGDCLLDKLF